MKRTRKKSGKSEREQAGQEVSDVLAKATPKAVRRLSEMMEEELPANVMLSAIKELLDRGLGKSGGLLKAEGPQEGAEPLEIVIKVLE